MKDFTKRYTQVQIDAAKAYINENFDTRATSGADYDRLLDQVLQVQNPTGRPWSMDDLPSPFPKPAAHMELEAKLFAKPIEATYLPREEEEPLLNLDNVRKMPEMQRDNQQTLEDKTVGRLMLAMARGEIRLELDGTPGGKARDMRRIKDYLDTTADIEGALGDIGVPVGDMAMLNLSRTAKHVIVTPIKDNDE